MKKVILTAFLVHVMAQAYILTAGNQKDDQLNYQARPGDVVITEIMADPVPAVDLPPEEYIEIFNHTGNSINLDNWKLSSSDEYSYFPGVIIEPGEYLIICAVSDTSLFSSYGRSIGLKPFPALTDKGRVIILTDDQNNIICGVEYSSDWYGSTLKSGGGWSLEIIDNNYPFYAAGNWEASSSRSGGTPGSVNSSNRHNPDKYFEGITNVFAKDSTKILIEFSEPVIDFTSQINGVILEEHGIAAAGQSDPLYRCFTLSPGGHLLRGKLYTLYLPENVTDFAGNEPSAGSVSFGLTEAPGSKDLVFNEILFNPFPENPDYIEFFNLSEKNLDASDFLLAAINDETGNTSEAKPISSVQRCIIPGAYYTITTDRTKVTEGFPASVPENIFEVSSLPSMPDDRGHILLLNRHLDKIDEVIYSEKMHYNLLSDNEGIALEKVRQDLQSDESKNWHSASESYGWGSPGAANSVLTGSLPETGILTFSSSRISPDNDGYEDVLVMDIATGDPGSTVTVTLFDETGSYVRKIAENYLAGNRASLVWDGTYEDGTPVHSGIYIVLTEIYTNKGTTGKWKKVCAVIRR